MCENPSICVCMCEDCLCARVYIWQDYIGVGVFVHLCDLHVILCSTVQVCECVTFWLKCMLEV